jgi:WD40 repeat protein
MSPDGSVFAVVETKGEPDGPNGSRILLFNTHSWEILRLIDFPDRKISMISFLPPNGDLLLCHADKQIPLKQPAEFLLVDGRTGTVTASGSAPSGSGTIFRPAPDGRSFLAGATHSDALTVYQIRDGLLSVERQEQAADGISAMALSPSGKTLTTGSGNAIQWHSLPDLSNFKKVSTGSQSSWTSILPLSDSDILAFSDSGEVYRCTAESAHPVLDHFTPIFCADAGEGKIALVKSIQSEIQIFQTPDLRMVETILPKKLRPSTRREISFLAYIGHSRQFLALDAEGTLYILYRSGKRWQKEIVFSAMK